MEALEDEEKKCKSLFNLLKLFHTRDIFTLTFDPLLTDGLSSSNKIKFFCENLLKINKKLHNETIRKISGEGGGWKNCWNLVQINQRRSFPPPLLLPESPPVPYCVIYIL